VYIEDVCHISATVATYAVIVLVLHEAVSSKLILPVLKYYDPKLQLVLQSDASESGLGATIMQKNQPIAYASYKALVIVSVLQEAVSSELILAVCDLTSLEMFFHMYIGEIVDHHCLNW
jgi:hypothetical protein